MQAIKEEIRLNLTGDVLEFELTDKSLTSIINSSLREIQRYIDTVAIVTVPYERCIDMSSFKVSSVIGVRRTEGYAGEVSETSGAVMDPLYASQWQILSGMGNMTNLTDYAYNFAAWNTVLQVRNTISTDLSHYFDKMSNKLYINVASNLPDRITIIYIPRFDDVSKITSDFWIDVLVRHAVAQTKIIVGRVRSKFTQTNALWTMDGSTILEEGKAELAALREELKNSTQLVYGID